VCSSDLTVRVPAESRVVIVVDSDLSRRVYIPQEERRITVTDRKTTSADRTINIT